MTLADYLHSLRQQHNLSVEAAAVQVGCDPIEWEAAEEGRTSLSSIVWPKLATKLNADIRRLNKLEEEMDAQERSRAYFRKNFAKLVRAIRSVRLSNDGDYSETDIWRYYGRCEGVIPCVKVESQIRFDRALARAMNIYYCDPSPSTH